jgi:hypothetical protein
LGAEAEVQPEVVHGLLEDRHTARVGIWCEVVQDRRNADDQIVPVAVARRQVLGCLPGLV